MTIGVSEINAPVRLLPEFDFPEMRLLIFERLAEKMDLCCAYENLTEHFEMSMQFIRSGVD